ncbi:MAG: Ger(x)C family spore germination protein [Oscillospiraceae bacterium]|jgi:spore germination protein KC|nr:Ger(x)C family spore germination protein [Oscillospiraceae bacterium]
MKLCSAFGTLFLFILFFSGCSGQRQFHDRLIVLGIGVDFSEEKYKATVSVFDANSSSSEKEIKPKILQSEGVSVFDALSKINIETGEHLTYTHNIFLLIGEEVAKKGVNSIMDFFVRYYESRANVSLFSVKGLASEIMNFKVSKDETITPGAIEEIANADFLSAKEVGSNILKFVSSLQNATSDPETLCIKIEKTENNNFVKSEGLAVFSDDKLSGFLDADESLGVMLLAHKARDATKFIKIPEIGDVNFSITDSNNKYDFSTSSAKFICNTSINVKASIYEINRADSFSNVPLENYFHELEKKLKENLEFLANKVINKVIYKYESDILCIGQRLFQNNPEYYKKVFNNWKTAIKNAEYNVNVSVKLERTGREV